MSAQDLPLLNVYEVEHEGRRLHLLGFADPVLAGSSGLDHACIVGELEPDDDGALHPDTLRVNPEFVAALKAYLDQLPRTRPAIVEQGRAAAGDPRLVLLDPRFDGGPDDEPPIEEVLGSYALEPDGAIRPGSFVYNAAHRLFDPNRGSSGLFFDLLFYEWLHPEARRQPPDPLNEGGSPSIRPAP